ncbi:unnamed protein product, partial [Clonostachys byssicola]
ETTPINYGVVVMPGAALMDVYGPLEVLYLVTGRFHINLKIISPDGKNVKLTPPLGNQFNSTFAPEYVASASFDDDIDLDVLIVPGGAAARDTSLTYVDDYLVKMYPKLDYLISICTGAIFPARAGLYNGRRVTTNKNAWNLVTAHGNNVTWVAPARYVIDGNIWSSSGVSAGVDLMLHWVKEWYGEAMFNTIRIGGEHIVHGQDDDPFTDELGVPHQGQL